MCGSGVERVPVSRVLRSLASLSSNGGVGGWEEVALGEGRQGGHFLLNLFQISKLGLL